MAGNNSKTAGPALQMLKALLFSSMTEILGKYLIIAKWLRVMFIPATAGAINLRALPSCRRCSSDFEKVQHNCKISLADKYSVIKSKIAGGSEDNRVFRSPPFKGFAAVESVLILQHSPYLLH